MTQIDLKATAALLEASGEYRVISRFHPPAAYNRSAPSAVLRTVAVIDSETTGLDAKKDKVIELGYVIARFDPATGQVFEIVSRHSSFEDPGFPLPDNIKAITGIRDEDVCGQHFDDALIENELAGVDLIVAHNAPFDRAFLEARFPFMQHLWWACSQREAPWSVMQTGSTKLEWLVHHLLRLFYDAHRALTDAEVLLHLLATGEHDGHTLLFALLQESRKRTYRVWALHSPYDMKDTLKAEMKYKWSDGTDPDLPFKAWYKDAVTDIAAEAEMLAERIYPADAMIPIDEFSGRERYSNRVARRFDFPVSRVKP